MISVCVCTNKNYDTGELRKFSPVEIIVSSQDGSAAYNRNWCLNRATGDIIIFVDDDITGFYDGWIIDLIKPLLLDKEVMMVSARLLNPDGSPAPMMYDNHIYKGYHRPIENVVPTACVAMRKTNWRFDEMFEKSGYEDTDFCQLMNLVYGKKVVINNNCKLIHLASNLHDNEAMRRNKELYLSKWGTMRSPKKKYLTTLIYYTANTERPEFEKKIIEGIREVSGDLPIISVSQKPMDFGKNICVGEVGHSYVNAFRQILIGAEAADTPFVATVESDCLYPKGYFDFKPTDPKTIYTYDNAWVLWNKYEKFFKKEQTHATLFYGREFLIKMIRDALTGCPEWTTDKIYFQLFKPEYRQEVFTGDPVVSFKTDEAPNKGTWLNRRTPKTKNLPYWGNASELKKRLCS